MPGRIGREGNRRRGADPPPRPGRAGFEFGIGTNQQGFYARAFGRQCQAACRGQIKRGGTAPQFDQHKSQIPAAQSIHRRFQQGLGIGRGHQHQSRRIDAQLDKPGSIDAASLTLGTIVPQPQDRVGGQIGKQGEGTGTRGIALLSHKLVQRRLGKRRGDAFAPCVAGTRNIDWRGRNKPRRKRQRVNHSSWFVLVSLLERESQAAGCTPHVLQPGSFGRRMVRSDGARPSIRCNLPA